MIATGCILGYAALGQAITKPRLPSWIVEAIALSYESQGNNCVVIPHMEYGCLVGITPGFSLEEICVAAK